MNYKNPVTRYFKKVLMFIENSILQLLTIINYLIIYIIIITYRGSEPAYGWCFLENIEDPTDATKNCFPDALWSFTHGRFWSHRVNIIDCKFLMIFLVITNDINEKP